MVLQLRITSLSKDRGYYYLHFFEWKEACNGWGDFKYSVADYDSILNKIAKLNRTSQYYSPECIGCPQKLLRPTHNSQRVESKNLALRP
jgi:hypothetical protein